MKMRDMLKRLLTGEEAQDIVEYALLVAFVGLTALAAWLAIQDALNGAYGRMDTRQQDLSAVTPNPQ